MIQGFKKFIMRGNVIDLAVAVVVGAAFTAIVNSIVEGILNPLIASMFSADTLAQSLVVDLSGKNDLLFGKVLAAGINFLLVAAVVYFVFVLPINKFKEAQARRDQPADVSPADQPPTELELLTQIRDLMAAGSDHESKHTA
ncbi:large conductance mechanosensitive channel protein MscL [Cryobacterium tepidiphilum]|uniref:Large-conductance mechanosensitive channel n=1 Tax=Cryobacterium tepidiphilum TaxID=2486026 RepID=A0A3M8KXF8_9MICO|nr:large conductance mechanosensitive channel protein MscL [Cryobacterium tepidiphilum]RNE56998.1 large conductance mechanosensitive channel protein MscL [Cryobacterium tepidiphilum]